MTKPDLDERIAFGREHDDDERGATAFLVGVEETLDRCAVMIRRLVAENCAAQRVLERRDDIRGRRVDGGSHRDESAAQIAPSGRARRDSV